jgi:hypothetical protein
MSNAKIQMSDQWQISQCQTLYIHLVIGILDFI